MICSVLRASRPEETPSPPLYQTDHLMIGGHDALDLKRASYQVAALHTADRDVSGHHVGRLFMGIYMDLPLGPRDLQPSAGERPPVPQYSARMPFAN
jgi:hypothetical protein